MFSASFVFAKAAVLARLPTRLPPWPWRCAGRVRAFPLVVVSDIRSVFVRCNPLGQSGPAPGFSARWQIPLSRNMSQSRTPKRPFVRRSRNRSRNQPLQERTGGTGAEPSFLPEARVPEARVRHAPARAEGPGVGKVLRKVSIDPRWVNLRKRQDRDVKPRRADSRTRFRTQKGVLGLTPGLQEFSTRFG